MKLWNSSLQLFKSKVIHYVAILLISASCATVFGGPRTAYQRTKPLPGEPQREMKVGALIWGLFFPPGLIVDFATGAIYKPEPTKKNRKK